MEFLKNPHLDGNPFFLKGNRIGFLLIHGFTATTTEVRMLAEKLHKDGFTVSAPLLPGHMTTPDDMNSRSWKEWYGAVKSSFFELKTKVDTVFLCGESMGALLSLLLASRQSGIKGLLIFSPALIIKNIWISHLIRPFIKYIPKGGKEDGLPWKGYTVNPVHAITELNKVQTQSRKTLPSITTPIAIFQSKNDETVDPHGAEVIYENIGSKDKEIHWFNQSAHCMILDKQLNDIYVVSLNFVKRLLK
jgi:carboxylesterase